MRISRATDSEIHIVLDTADIGLDASLPGQTPSPARVADLDARVKWLEGALGAILRVQRARAGARAVSGSEGSAPVASAGALECTQRLAAMPQSAPPDRPVAAAPVLERRRPTLDSMCFTSAFATLDERLHQQMEMEAAALRRPDLAPPVTIDPALIDRAFARPAPQRIEVRADLEQTYPHLLDRITAAWGTPEVAGYLRKLIVDERGGRQGFPYEVMSELLTLSALLEGA